MPTESKHQALEIPRQNVWDFLFMREDRPFPNNKVIFSDSESKRSYTFGQLRDISTRFGAGLKSEYLWKKGDILGIFSPNDVDYPAAIWGVHKVGETVSLINPNYTETELEFQLVDSGVKVLVAHQSVLPLVLQVIKKIGFPQTQVLLLGDNKNDPLVPIKHFKSLGRPATDATTVVDPASDLAFLVYSSGTTGKPKGVMLTHSNIVSNILQYVRCQEGYLTWNGGPNGRGDSAIGFLPFFHSYGLLGLVHFALYMGIEIIVMAKFDLTRFCAITAQKKVTFASVVPPILLLLAKSPVAEKYDLSSLRVLCSGAAPLSKDLVHAVQGRLKIPVMQGYGLSETSPMTHCQAWGDAGKPIGSIGRLLPNQTSKIISPSGEEVPDGEVGELLIKGPNVFKGYLNNEAQTKRSITSDGYFRTGDVGYQDGDGNVFITDRIKELIKYNAFQVAPAELEGVLMSHPKIADVAVVGVHDKERATEVPRAYVVTVPGVEHSSETTKAITLWMEKKVANHKQLRGGIRYVDAIPKTASGKILRSDLRTQANKEADGLSSKL